MIDITECANILKSFSNNKSPGNDGIPSEFYRYFWNEVKTILVNCFNYSYEHGELSTSQKQSVITLIHKKDKDRLYLENWRPISLLNVDYKILTKVLTNRLQDVMPHLVDITQSAYIKGRLMGDSVRTLQDIIEYCQLHACHGLLLMVDFTKAFDSLEWDFLFKTLSSMNFGDSFIKWIKVLYTNVESCIINNGTTSKYFKLQRGVRQGDPLSAYLFILCMEIFSSSIMNNKNVAGITINNHEYKIVQYADDLTAVLKDEKSVNAFITELDKFKDISGLHINVSKTSAILLGNAPQFKLPNNMQWKLKPTKVLGIYIGTDVLECANLTIQECIRKMKTTINIWKQRQLTLTGKVLIIKTLIISQLIHIANLVPIPEDAITDINKILYEFLWNGKTHKVKKNVIIQNFKRGGYKMIDLKSLITAQKLKWIKLYLNDHKCLWTNSMTSLIDVQNLNIFFLCNYDMSKQWSNSLFYSDVIRTLYDVNKANVAYLKCNILNQFIHYNRHLKFENKVVYDKEFLNAGLWTISDLFYPNNNLIPFNQLTMRGISKNKYMLWRCIISAVKCIRNKEVTLDRKEQNYELVIDLPKEAQINITLSTSKDVYTNLITLSYESPVSIKKYANLFPILNNITCDNIFLNPRVCTKNNHLKDFQYQIIHRYLPTNYLLYKMGKVNSIMCTLCRLNTEHITHLFFDCVCVKVLWSFVEKLLEKLERRPFHLSCIDVILGYDISNQQNSYDNVNNIILYAKDFIWHCRKYNDTITVNGFESWLDKHKRFDHSLEICLE